jgi:hypothetical protein
MFQPAAPSPPREHYERTQAGGNAAEDEEGLGFWRKGEGRGSRVGTREGEGPKTLLEGSGRMNSEKRRCCLRWSAVLCRGPGLATVRRVPRYLWDYTTMWVQP